MKKIILLIIVIFSLLKNNSSAQENNLGSWNILNIKCNMDEKWSLFGEAQLRSLKMYDEFNYYEYKGGINYKANKNLRLTFGAGSHQTYKSGGNFITPKKNDDFRLWPQIVLLQSINRIEIEQRYRAEWRFTGNGNLNRFRYRLGFIYPFGKKHKKTNPLMLT